MLISMAWMGAAVWLYMTVWFVIAVVRRDNSLADIAWGCGFVLLAVVALVRTNQPTATAWLTAGLTLVWAIRLSAHIAGRSRGRSEDWRYARWRREWGDSWLVRSYLQVFVLQGVILLIVAAPVWWTILRSRSAPTVPVFVGAGVWLFGTVFEGVADLQLLRFGNDPANRSRVLDHGLWAWSRHPNYFGEMLVWWGAGVVAVAATGAWWTLVGPLLITWLLLRVSGVTMLEEGLAERRPGYREYQRRTSAFVPLPPRARRS